MSSNSRKNSPRLPSYLGVSGNSGPRPRCASRDFAAIWHGIIQNTGMLARFASTGSSGKADGFYEEARFPGTVHCMPSSGLRRLNDLAAIRTRPRTKGQVGWLSVSGDSRRNQRLGRDLTGGKAMLLKVYVPTTIEIPSEYLVPLAQRAFESLGGVGQGDARHAGTLGAPSGQRRPLARL